MANKKITDLTDIGTPAADDVLEIVDISTNTSKSVKFSEFGGSQTLAETLALGNITDGTDISISNGDAVILDNGSMLKKGTIDAGNGGAKGISQICAVGYEHKWEAGRLYIMNDGGTTIREVSHNFAVTPTVTDDDTKGFVVDTRWILDNGDIYLCTDATTGSAVWELVNSGVATLQQVTDNGNETTNEIKVKGNIISTYYDNDETNGYVKTEGGFLRLKAPLMGGGEALILATFIENGENPQFELPNKPSGGYYFATTDDIPLIDATPTDGSSNAVSSNGVFDALALKENSGNKQNSLSADGTGVKFPTVDAVNTAISNINTNAVDKITVKLALGITKGQAVYISSANGTNIIVSKASNTSEATSSKTLGLLETTGATNAIVNVITSGLLDGLDTSTATIGDAVWLGTSGNLLFGLANKPTAPAHLVYIGVVSRVSATVGEIIVKVQNGFELNEIHDVSISGLADNNLLAYENSTSLWKNKTASALGIAPLASPTFTGTVVLPSTTSIGTVSATEIGYLDNVTSSIQTQLNARIKSIVSDAVASSTVSGVTAETLAKTYTISANTLASTDFMNVVIRAYQTVSTNAGTGFTVRLKINSTNNFATATTIATATTTSAFNPYSTIQRHFEIKSSLLQGVVATTSLFSDFIQNANARLSTAITTSADFYLYVSIQPTATTESYQISSVQITN